MNYLLHLDQIDIRAATEQFAGEIHVADIIVIGAPALRRRAA
jgi:hypothetical protein